MIETSTDPLYAKACAAVLENKHASISFVQRTLHIEWPHAARLVEQMERDGLVSPILDEYGRRNLT